MDTAESQTDKNLTLRDRRLDRELTQGELAVLVGVGQSSISKLETGRCRRPRPKNLGRLARALGITVPELRKHFDGKGKG